MHRIRCGSAIFPHQALERRTVQETAKGCAGRITKTSKGIGHFTLYNWIEFQSTHSKNDIKTSRSVLVIG
jgi:hypothetical protein